ncbi:2-amino-4-hydroxy-6-hydroxymethyldihydropteridine diphosphokinase [Lacticaseibacillus sp. GG6-2]
MTEAYLGLGTNIGDRLHRLHQARSLLDQTPEVQVVRASLVYETQPVGGVVQDDYLNQVVVIQTPMPPMALLRRLHDIERVMHRQRIVRWGARTVDLDLLYYDDLTMRSAELTLPHPQIPNRRFVLVPLLEVATGPRVAEVAALLKTTPDHNWVRPYIQK